MNALLWGKSMPRIEAERIESLETRKRLAEGTPEALGRKYGDAVDYYFGTDISRPSDYHNSPPDYPSPDYESVQAERYVDRPYKWRLWIILALAVLFWGIGPLVVFIVFGLTS